MASKNQVIILAAGQGKRLRPLTDNTPKCLIKVGEFPILHRQLKNLEENDLKDIILVVGFMAEAVKEYATGHFPRLNFNFVYNPNFETTNTLYSLALASEQVNAAGTVLLLNGDVVFEPEIIKYLLKDDDGKSFIAVQLKKCREEEVKISLKRDGSVALLNKKTPLEKAIGEAIGINKFRFSFWRVLTKNLSLLKNDFSLEYFEYAVEETIEDGEKIFPFDVGELKAVEIDFAEDLKEAEKIKMWNA